MTDTAVPNAPPERRLSQTEFVALMAMMFSTIAFSIDAMLPALPEIAAELSPDAPTRATLIVTSFMLGMGLGTLFTGPLSDAFGRKPIILGGVAIYIIGSIIAWATQSIETMIAARILQGLGAAGPRVVTLALIRDLYAGRQMARIMSFVILIFTLVPAFAPTLGAGLIWLAGWRSIFLSFVIFSLIGGTWLALRQAETLTAERRRPFRPRVLWAGMREILGTRIVALTMIAQGLCFAMLFATLSSTQAIFDITFGQGHVFHLWFGLIAVLSAPSALLNASLVERLGMRVMINGMLAAQIALSGIALPLYLSGVLGPTGDLALYILWTVGIFFQAGLTLGNLNALAMEPMGHLAGLTASVVGSIATVMAVLIAAPVGMMFNGTPVPLMLATLIMAAAAWGLMQLIRRAEVPSG